MYKKILVPLDGSKLAECALKHVKEIARGCGTAEVDLLYVVAPLSAQVIWLSNTTTNEEQALTEGYEKKFEKWGKEYLDGVAKSFAKDGIAAKPIVLKGGAADVILDYTRDNAIDLVIMATHGRSGPARWAMGSVADRVLRQSVSPVMIVRPAECAVTV